MSSPILDGLQFPIQEQNNKPSTSKTGREIIAEALSTVNPSLAQQAIKEKIGVKLILNISRHL